MKITRRNFVQISGVAALSAALLGPVGKTYGQLAVAGDLFAVPAESLADPLNYLLKAHFEPFTGTAFRAGAGNDSRVGLRLKAVTDLTRAINHKRGFHGESFSLLFEGASRRSLAEGPYVFDHENLGRFTLYLSPVGKAGKNYEAVINRVGR
jgi:hypothetical protein